MSICRERTDNIEHRLTFFTDLEISEESDFLRARIAEIERLNKSNAATPARTTNGESLKENLKESEKLDGQIEICSKVKKVWQNDGQQMEKNSVAELNAKLEKNSVTINQLQSELKALREQQMDNSEQQMKDKAELLAKINEVRESKEKAQQRMEGHLNRIDERLRKTAFHSRYSKFVLEDVVLKKITAMEFILGMFIFLLLISPFVYYYYFLL